MEPELRAMWEEAEQNFKTKTAKKLGRAGDAKTLDDVIREMESRKVEDDSDGGKIKNRAKDIGQKVLNCIQLLGGIAAQGASMVFAPAGLCFNAVSFLIAIPGKVSKVYDILGDLFDKLFVSLSQFKIYERIEQYSNIDTALKTTIHKLLISFVDICGLSIDVFEGGTWGKLKVITKVTFFDDDSGVGAALAKFQSLVQEQSAVVDTLTLESVLKNEAKLAELHEFLKISDQKLDGIKNVADDIKIDVGVLLAADKGRKNDELMKQQLAKIEKKLAVKDTSTATHQTNLSDSMPGTGSWLDSIKEYSDWEDREAKVAPVLYLTGNKNFGRTFLTSAIVRKLQMRYRQGDSGTIRTCIAYYFFPKDSEKTDEKLQNVETALKWMSLQIAQGDMVYRKEMDGLCDAEESSDFSSLTCADLWQKLGFGSFKTNVAYFLLFDGVDQLTERMAKPLLDILSGLQDSSSTLSQLRLRVMVTGQEKTFGGSEYLNSVPSIDIGKHSRIDIEKYIDQRLEKMDNLQEDSDEKKNLRKKIRTELPDRAQGDFFKVRHSLDAISKERWADGITRTLSAAGDDRDTMLKREIAKCNEDLSTEDIEDLNELLAWVFFGQWWLTVEQLEAALFLRHEKTSLQPLKDRLDNEYSKFFEIDKYGHVDINTDMKDLVIRTQDESDREGNKAKLKELAQVKISESEIKMVRKFLLTFCEEEVYEKFGFKEFFAQKSKTSAAIGVEEKDAHLTIVKRSLKLLTLGYENETKSLALYTLARLPSHLESLGDPSKLSLSDKTFIETELFRVLTNDDIIEQRWQSDSALRETWIDETTAVETVWGWLKDSTIVRTLRETPKSWLSDAAPNSNVETRLLRKVVRVMAKRWLRGREWDVSDAFPWVRSFVAKIQGPKEDVSSAAILDNTNGSNKPDESDESDESEDIMTSASWVQTELEIQEPDSLWFERLGSTYLKHENYDCALGAFRQAKQLDKDSWQADEGLALTFAGQEEYQLAADEMETVLGAFRKTDDLRKEKAVRFVQNLKYLAIWKIELKEPDEAIKLYREALDIDPYEYKCVHGLLKVLESQGRIAEAQSLLDHMRDQSGKKQTKEHGVNLLVEMHLDFALDDNSADYYTTIFSITQKSQDYESLYQTLQSAIDAARHGKNGTTENNDLLGVLLFYQGSALARKHNDKSKAIPIWEESYKLALTMATPALMQAGRDAVREMSSYHFTQAIVAGYGSQGAQDHLQNLIRFATISVENKNEWWVYEDVASQTSEMAKLLLGRYYRVNGELAKAQEYLRADVQSGLDLLSDEDPENDWQGYLKLTEVLLHYGDDLNTLSAWSLIAPHDLTARSVASEEETKDSKAPAAGYEELPATTSSTAVTNRSGGPDQTCDGYCGTKWGFADDFYCCKYCLDIQFDQKCLDRLRAGTLDRDICSKDHEWLHVPPWSDEEYFAVGKGRVRVGGEMRDGKRVGGEVVDVQTWLDMLRKEWGISKPDSPDSRTANVEA